MNWLSKILGKSSDEFELKLLSDQPTSKDALKTHKPIAETLRSIIVSDMAKPFVIGLFGSWGSGKSSILRMLEDASNNQFKLVVVDAWRKDKENFLRQFIKKLADSLLTKETANVVKAEVDSRSSESKKTWKPSQAATWAFLVYVLVATAIIGLTMYGWLENNFLKDIGAPSFAILAAMFFYYFLPRYSQTTDNTSHFVTLDDPAFFREIYFTKILGESNAKLVCVAIDNLDRVPAEDALMIIRTVKTFIVDAAEDGHHEANKVVFLIACDDDALARRFKEDAGVSDAPEFLRKFFNVGLRIPLLQYQDSFNYVRQLLPRAGLDFSGDTLDQVAFVIERATGGNPRKPKYLINYFLSRLHLAQRLNIARETIQAHPEWFAVYVALESEFREGQFPRTIEAVRTEIEQLAALGRDSNNPQRAEFLSTVQHIAEAITPDAWFRFQFLKRPNVHELIPEFQELADSALSLNFDQFQSLLAKVRRANPDVLTALWNERTDSMSRMNLASAILSAVQKDTTIEIPARVAADIAVLVRGGVPGWQNLPPEIVYTRVFKERPAILADVLSNGVGNKQDPKQAAFISSIARLAMHDGLDNPTLRTGIVKVLEAYASSDGELVAFAVRYPRYSSEAVFNAARDRWQNRQGEIEFGNLVEYAKVLRFDGKQRQVSPTGQVIGALRKVLEGEASRQQSMSDEDYAAVLRMVKDMKAGRLDMQGVDHEAMPQILDRLFVVFDQSPARQHKAAYFILAILIEFTKQNNLNVNHSHVDRETRSRIHEFLRSGNENHVIELFQTCTEYMGQIDQGVVSSVGCRSEKLFAAVIKLLPSHRQALLANAVNNTSDVLVKWSQHQTNTLDDALKKEFSKTLVNLATAHQAKLFIYQAIHNLKMEGNEEIRSLLEKHFDSVIQTSPALTVPANLTKVLERMKMVDYQLTPRQREAIEKNWDLIDHAKVSPELRALVREVLG